MAFSISPAVTVSEFDLTTIVPQVATSIGGFVGAFQWGPADLIVQIDSEQTLVRTFWTPDANTYISFLSCASFLAYTNNLKVVRSVGPNANNATSSGTGLQIKNVRRYRNTYYPGTGGVGDYAARYPGALGNSILISTCPSANGWSQNLTLAYGITANTTNGSTVVAFSANVLANNVNTGDYLTVGSNVGSAELISITSNGLFGITNVASNVTVTGAVAIKNWKYQKFFTGAPNTSFYANSVGGLNDQMHVIVVDRLGLFSAGQYAVSSGGANNVLEIYPFVSKAVDAINQDGTSNYVRDVIANKSNFIYWMQNLATGTNWGNTAANTTFTDTPLNMYEQLAGGQTDIPTDATLQPSWDFFRDVDQVDVNLLLMGNTSSVTTNYVIQNVAQERQDCVVFLSPKQTDVVDQIGSEASNAVATRNLYGSTSYAVMDSNWKYMFDKYNNTYRWIPLNADVAGLCAYTDRIRDPWWSPAGLNRGFIKNVVRLAWNPKKSYRDTLYSASINPVVTFSGQGTVLFGDKTMLTQPSAFDRINVRRLFIVLEKAIATAAKYSLFEFNDEFTRAAFVNLVTPYLRDVQGRRGIYAFNVICDNTNNTQQVIDSNQFVGDIYIQPARSINAIQLNFVAVGTGVDFTIVAGKFG